MMTLPTFVCTWGLHCSDIWAIKIVTIVCYILKDIQVQYIKIFFLYLVIMGVSLIRSLIMFLIYCF